MSTPTIEDAERRFVRLLTDPDGPRFLLRVEAENPADTEVLRSGSVEDRARTGVKVLEHDLRWLETVGDDRVPALHCWTGTEIFAQAFGCEVHRPSDNMPFARPRVTTADEADDIEEPDIFEGPLGKLFEIADRMLALAGQYPVRVCDVQSPFDIAALIWDKQSLYEAMVENPDAVHRLVDKTQHTLVRFLEAFRARYRDVNMAHYPELYVPRELGLCLSEDEPGAMSRRHFQEFCLPRLRDLAERFGGISIHCCASAYHVWPDFKELGPRYMNLTFPPSDMARALSSFAGTSVLAPSNGNGRLADEEFLRRWVESAPAGTRLYFQTFCADAESAQAVFRRLSGILQRLDERGPPTS